MNSFSWKTRSYFASRTSRRQNQEVWLTRALFMYDNPWKAVKNFHFRRQWWQQTTSNHNYNTSDGSIERGLQELSQTCQTRARATSPGHWSGHASCTSVVSKPVSSTSRETAPKWRVTIFNFRRAKEKRLKKDAGRARWGEYFKTLKGCDVKSNDSDRDSEIDLEFNHCKLRICKVTIGPH